jgi:hypothetical protein
MATAIRPPETGRRGSLSIIPVNVHMCKIRSQSRLYDRHTIVANRGWRRGPVRSSTQSTASRSSVFVRWRLPKSGSWPSSWTGPSTSQSVSGSARGHGQRCIGCACAAAAGQHDDDLAVGGEAEHRPSLRLARHDVLRGAEPARIMGHGADPVGGLGLFELCDDRDDTVRNHLFVVQW